MTNASRIHDPHGSIMLRSPFLRVEGTVSRTAQCAIGLENKILAGQPIPFPGGGEDGGPIAGRGNGGRSRDGIGRDGGRS
jgi:hypothetical protein